MPFRIPRFNLTATIFRSYGPPFLPRPAGGNDVPAQLRLMRTSFSANTAAAIISGPLLLLPKRTDIRPGNGFGAGFGLGDVVEVPRLSGRFYRVIQVEDAARDFDNEYRVAQVTQLPLPTGFPIP
jgi:hypothetical protein